MQMVEVCIKSKFGFHSRSASKFVELIGKYHSKVTILSVEKVDPLSIISIMQFRTKKFSILISGEDEILLKEALEEFIEREL